MSQICLLRCVASFRRPESLLFLCVHILLRGPPGRREVGSHPQPSTGGSVATDSTLGGKACGSFPVISLLALSSEGENSGLYHRGPGGWPVLHVAHIQADSGCRSRSPPGVAADLRSLAGRESLPTEANLGRQG